MQNSKDIHYNINKQLKKNANNPDRTLYISAKVCKFAQLT